MDRLIDDYEKALTEEFELREPVHQARWKIKGIEAVWMGRLIDGDSKLPQWKAKEAHTIILHQDQEYLEAADELREAEYEHGKAGIRLDVTVERLKLTRARLYGGRHDDHNPALLDMQETGKGPEADVD